MARTRSITNAHILEAAREVFTTQGIEATTADIARAAGISEGTIFARFKTKDELFVQAMCTPQSFPWLDGLHARVGQHTVRENLEWLAGMLTDFFLEMIPKFSMAFAQSSEIRQQLLRTASPPPVQALKSIAAYIEREQHLGRISLCDPEIFARALMGAIHHFAFTEIHGINERLYMPRTTYLRGVVTLLLGGLLPAQPAP